MQKYNVKIKELDNMRQERDEFREEKNIIMIKMSK